MASDWEKKGKKKRRKRRGDATFCITTSFELAMQHKY